MPATRTSRNRLPAWKKTLYCIVFAQFMSGFGFASFNPFLPLYLKHLGAAGPFSVELLMGLVFSGQAFTMMLASPLWGILADRYGRKLMVERAMFGGTLIVFFMAFARCGEELVGLRMVQGAITGVISANSALLAATVPREHTGFAMGLLQVALGAGIAFGPFVGGVVADLCGYHCVFFITSAMLLAAGMVVLLGVEEKFTPVHHNPAQGIGFLQKWRMIWSSAGVPAIYSMRFLSQFERMMIMPALPLFVQAVHRNLVPMNAFTGLVVGAWSVTTTLSAGYLGRWGDRIGHAKILMACSLMIGAIYMLQSLTDSAIRLLCLQALVGAALGGIVPSISALLVRSIPSGSEGAAFGLDNSVTSFSWSVAPMVSVSIISTFGLRSVFVATGVLFFLIALIGRRCLTDKFG
jgi:DHA1 family multidrug resistance protein-like MFS transporter